jgi:uncharacterized SAM-binding protein YcdF (DUF218 family)
VNDLLGSFDLGPMRPLLGALIMPPVPFLLIILAGAFLMRSRRRLAWWLVGLGSLGIWFSATSVGADMLRRWLQPPVSALAPIEVRELRHSPRTAIVVLGGGAKPFVAEYGAPDLNALSLDRLRYASWLARETGLPVLFSGGRGHGAASRDAAEAQIAAHVAERDFRMPLRWQESESRDTRENAIRSVAMLHAQGIERIVLVTHAYHMPRAQHNFERAVQGAKLRMRIVVAPMDVRRDEPPTLMDFVPSRNGFYDVRLILHEWVGRAVGA